MASHVYLALQSKSAPGQTAELGRYLSGAVAPDVRYLDGRIARETTHDLSLGLTLGGSFGAGYRHHLAVDRAFYRRCSEQAVLRRLGAMNATILAEMHALRALAHVPRLQMPEPQPALIAAGVAPQVLETLIGLSDTYLAGRDIDQAIRLLSGPLRERAARYLARWERWGPHLKRVSRVAAPLLERLFQAVGAEAEGYLEEVPPCR